MGANRAMRRQQERNQIREWKQKNQYDQVLSIRKNGITEKDLDTQYKKGYDEGYMYASEGFLKKMYAAIARELLDSGNSKDEVVYFLKAVDDRFAVMFDADEEINAVMQDLGVQLNIDRNAVRRVEET